MDLNAIKEHLLDIGGVGRGEDGAVNRLLFTPEYDAAAEKLMAYMQASGLTVHRDSVGNIHGILPATRPNAPTLYTGSHLDTVRDGGLYDGAMGVIAGVECARRFVAEEIDRSFNLHILATNGEEGNDLGGTFGSRCMMGLIDFDQPGYLDIAAGFGLTSQDMEQAKLDTTDALGYLELHIEQGKTLDEAGEDLGVVTGIVGLRRWQITVLGEANHAGTTMMEFRHDAMVAASRLIVRIDEMAREYGHDLVATVGKFQLFPNSAPVVPGKAELVLEVRSREDEKMLAFFRRVQVAAAEIEGVEFQFSPIVAKAPVQCDDDFISALEAACYKSGLRWRKMSSGATHDGNAFAMKMPIGMLFVPSKDGISHNKREFTTWEQIDAGVETLYQALLELNRQHREGA
jgi:hydantoinase/carbamoylase family amidase